MPELTAYVKGRRRPDNGRTWYFSAIRTIQPGWQWNGRSFCLFWNTARKRHCLRTDECFVEFLDEPERFSVMEESPFRAVQPPVYSEGIYEDICNGRPAAGVRDFWTGNFWRQWTARDSRGVSPVPPRRRGGGLLERAYVDRTRRTGKPGEKSA